MDPRLVRRVTAASFVLLRNEGQVLPFDPGRVGSIALIGPNAVYPVIQGGGSAIVAPVTVSTPAAALPAALAGQASVTVAPGCRTWTTVPEPVAGSLRDPVTGEPGLRLEFRAGDGKLIRHEHRTSTQLAWWDEGLPAGVGWGESGTITLLTRYRADVTGQHLIGVAGVGQLTLAVDGAVVADTVTPVPADPVQTMTRPGEVRAAVGLRAGQEADVRLDFRPADGIDAPLAVSLGIAADEDEDTMIAEAVRAAAGSAAAVVVVGSAEAAESEGIDRETLALPGRQDELVTRIAAVNPRTVVVVNAGMPVLMPWADDVAAVIYAWLPGQAMGEALADVLLGRAEPGAGCPSPCPSASPTARSCTPSPATAASTTPRGCSSATAATTRRASPRCSRSAMGSATPSGPTSPRRWTGPPPHPARTSASGSRSATPGHGRAARSSRPTWPARWPGRPARALGAFAAVGAEPGERAEVVLTVPARAFAVWDPAAGGWAWPPGTFTVEIGRSSRDLRLGVPVTGRRIAAITGQGWARAGAGAPRLPARPSGGRGRDQLDLVALTVLQVGGVVVVSPGERVAVRVEQPPAVIRRVQRELVQFLTGCDMEGEMIHPRPAAVVPARYPVRRLLDDDVGDTRPPALALGPLLIDVVAQLPEQPPPAGLGPGQIGYPELDVMKHPSASVIHARQHARSSPC